MRPIAVDAMGGDYAPQEIVAGVLRAVSEFGIPVMLVGRPDELREIDGTAGIEVIEAREVVPMEAPDPGVSVRRMRDSSIVRAAEAVRDGQASAMVSAGNTGAAMGAALLKIGRIAGVARPAVATPIPAHGTHPTTMLDCGANAECRPEWLLQFARMGAVYARDRFGIGCPRVGLLSIGEEAGKGSVFVKEAFELLDERPWARTVGAEWIGNVEGGDIMTGDVDVVVTDGFTGNVALKALEGALRDLMGRFSAAIEACADSRVLRGILGGIAGELHPDTVGGALLLGVKGVCVVSHGASRADAIMNAVAVAHEMAEAGIVDHIADIAR